MADDRLKNFVLSLADTDNALSEQVRLVVLAALEGSNDLAEVLGDDATSSELVESLTAVEEESAEPVGAYLRSITVQGFRGIGAEVTLPFRPGPGLIVVAGRNGSGKSPGRGSRTGADGHKLTLERQGSGVVAKLAQFARWRSRYIRVVLPKRALAQRRLASTGRLAKMSRTMTSRRGCSGTARSVRTPASWAGPCAGDVPAPTELRRTGRDPGGPAQRLLRPAAQTAWTGALTEAMARLDAEVKQLKQPSVDLRKARDALRPSSSRTRIRAPQRLWRS